MPISTILSSFYSTETTLSTSSLSLLSKTKLTTINKLNHKALLTFRFAEEYTEEIQNEDKTFSRRLLEKGDNFIKELYDLGFIITAFNDENSSSIMALLHIDDDRISEYLLNNNKLNIPLLIDAEKLEILWYKNNKSDLNHYSNSFDNHYICYDTNLFEINLFYKPSSKSILYSESTQLKVMHYIFTNFCNIRNLIENGLLVEISYLHNNIGIYIFIYQCIL